MNQRMSQLTNGVEINNSKKSSFSGMIVYDKNALRASQPPGPEHILMAQDKIVQPGSYTALPNQQRPPIHNRSVQN
jgi:hypothetical protein